MEPVGKASIHKEKEKKDYEKYLNHDKFYILKIFLLLVSLVLIIFIDFVNVRYGLEYILLSTIIAAIINECYAFNKYLKLQSALLLLFNGKEKKIPVIDNVSISTYVSNDEGKEELDYTPTYRNS